MRFLHLELGEMGRVELLRMPSSDWLRNGVYEIVAWSVS
jgi:hypothetical protein